MPSQQPTDPTAINRSSSLIERVLNLRRQLEIDIPLSISDSEDMFPFPVEREPSMETSGYAQPVYDSRDWLSWSQSPNEGNQPEKGAEEIFRCQ